MIKKLCVLVGVACLATACSGTKSTKVAAVQKNDKRLTCNEILLEINEAEFWRDKAENNRGMSFRNLVSPFGYGSTYISASDAIEASDTRVSYLKRIYDIKRCDDPTQQTSAPEAAPSSPAPYAAAYPTAPAPVYQAQPYAPQPRYYQPAPYPMAGQAYNPSASGTREF